MRLVNFDVRSVVTLLKCKLRNELVAFFITSHLIYVLQRSAKIIEYSQKYDRELEKCKSYYLVTRQLVPKTQPCFLRFRTLIFMSVVTTEKGVKHLKSQKRFLFALFTDSQKRQRTLQRSPRKLIGKNLLHFLKPP